MTRLRIVAPLLASLFLLACDRRVEPYVPVEQEPPAADRPVRIPGLEKPTPRQRPASRAPAIPASATGSIRGTLELGPRVGAAGQGVLFVILRSEAAGPPLAVKRLPVGPFPMDFEIGPADAMRPGTSFAGPLRLSARVDRDRNAGTRGPQDLTGEVPGLVELGSGAVKLVLRRAGG